MTQAALYLCEDGCGAQECQGVFDAVPLRNLSEEGKEEFRATLALRHTPGLGARSMAKLLKHYGSASRAVGACHAWTCMGIKARCAHAFEAGAWRQSATREWNNALASDAALLLWRSGQYPACLRELPDAPALLYCKGDLALLASPCVALVGSRNPTAYNESVAMVLGTALSECGITVVSGMALGIDRQAHLGALKGIGRSIGILGTGIGVQYPRSNADVFRLMSGSGLLVSEFPPDAPPAAGNFPIRNRIISGLSLGVVVVEAAARSGSLITARYALEQNREIFAVPGSAMNSCSQGCQNLVREGARAVFCADDIIHDLAALLKPYGISQEKRRGDAINTRPDRPVSRVAQCACKPDSSVLPVTLLPPLPIDAAGEKVLEFLRGSGPLDMDKLLEITGMSSGELNSAILGLELAGRVARLPGARFEVVP